MKKRYKSVDCEVTPEGCLLLLDRKPATTPLGMPYVIKSGALAQAIAAEWREQGDFIRKDRMPLSQLASIALDLTATRSAEVCADMLSYAESDLICYRAGDIQELKETQARLLDPIVAWAEATFGIALTLADGVMPVRQPPDNKAKLLQVLSGFDAWKLAALAVAVKSLGSFILGLALVERHIDGATAFALSHLEETYETEKWGPDEEKDTRLLALAKEVTNVERFLSLMLSS